MTYKTKLTVLSGIIAVLALVYTLSFVFDTDRINSRSAAYSWLDSKQAEEVTQITINSSENKITLVQKNGGWFVVTDGSEYPARNLRVADFIRALAKKAPYPVISSNALSHERLSLTGETQVVVTGTGERTLLNLLVGAQDVSGHNVYLRRQDRDEIRCGEDIFSAYIYANTNSWYNLLLFPESESGKLNVTSVQRLTVYPPATDAPSGEPLIFSRKNKMWFFNFDVVNPDMEKVDLYIRQILNASGDGFADDTSFFSADYNDCSIVLELGDGSIKSLRMGPPVSDEDPHRYATVSGSNLVYSIPGWVIGRLFPDIPAFEKD